MSGTREHDSATTGRCAPFRVLLIDDSAEDRELARASVETRMSEVEFAEITSRAEFDRAILQHSFDAVVTEYSLTWSNGLSVLRETLAHASEAAVIMFTASGSEEVCAEGLRSGLFDYVLKKPGLFIRLTFALRRAQDLMNARIAVRRRTLELEESEHRFRTMADTAPVLIWLAAPSRARTWVNRSWLEFTGRRLEKELGHGWIEGVHPDDRHACVDVYRAAFAAERPFRSEYRLLRADGEYRWVMDTGTPRWEGHGSLAGYIGSVIDITERRRAEEVREQLFSNERRAREQAESAGRLKDEFLATLSHELRTPLNAILGWTQLLQKSDVDPEDLARGLAVIERSALSQAQLVEDLLDMSRIVSGTFRIDPRPCDPSALVELAVSATMPAALARRVELAYTPSTDIGRVLADGARIQQILWNLISNALKFTEPGGRIEIALEHSSDELVLTVSDDGQGISPEFLPYVFDRFRQANASDAARRSGLGLGLSIVKHLCEAHGGSVRAESEGAGRGSRFVVTLPLRRVEEETSPATEAPEYADLELVPPSLAGATVLIVDDDDDARALLTRVLSERGAEIVGASSVEQALHLFRSHLPDVMISDLSLSGTDGCSLVRCVRRLDRRLGGTVPAIAITAHASPEDRRRALLSGFQLHVPRPIDAAEIVAAVASVLSRCRVTLPAIAEKQMDP